jgi:Domain of unknown function (DUF5071)
MRIVPEHKQDIEACSALAQAKDSEIAPVLPELLAWLQDMNWPVARLVQMRIESLGIDLAEPIREVLKGSDDIWKTSLISSLLPRVHSSVVESLEPELNRILESPSEGEIAEEVQDAVRALCGS